MPFSFSPLGPRGRGQIQNARPRFRPGFFVVRLTHGSWWLSQRGAGFLVKSLPQSSLLTIGSKTVSVWDLSGDVCVEPVPGVEISVSAVGSRVWEAVPVVCVRRVGSALGFVGDDVPLSPYWALDFGESVEGLVDALPPTGFDLKKPLSVF